MKRGAESRRSTADSTELIDRVSEVIHPDDAALAEWFTGYCREHRARLAADLVLVESHCAPGARLLEYGAIPLVMTTALTARAYDVSAVDVEPRRFATSIEALELDVEQCDVETEPVPFDTETFDVVLFNELFEHLRINPIFTVREIHRVLKPGGTLLLSTPNLRSFRGLRNLVFHHRAHAASTDVYREYEKLETLGHMGHVREYTVREVSDFLTRIGFEVEEIIYRGGYGHGVVGLAERIAPSLRPFFALVARKRQ